MSRNAAYGIKPKLRLPRRLRWPLYALAGLLALTLLLVLPWRWLNPPTSAFMLRYSVQQRDAPARGLYHAWVDLSTLRRSVPLAFLVSEDQRFFHHHGVDLDAARDAALDYLKGGGRLRGASTITQQVAKNLYLWPERSWLRKALEAYLAIVVDLLWPKRRILEVYLNLVELAPGVYGIGAGAWLLLNKRASDLTAADAALLAAVLPNPKRLSVLKPSPEVIQRRDWILEQLPRYEIFLRQHGLKI